MRLTHKALGMAAKTPKRKARQLGQFAAVLLAEKLHGHTLRVPGTVMLQTGLNAQALRATAKVLFHKRTQCSVSISRGWSDVQPRPLMQFTLLCYH